MLSKPVENQGAADRVIWHVSRFGTYNGESEIRFKCGRFTTRIEYFSSYEAAATRFETLN